ncbi:ABC transporter permease [Puia sp.]|uniref:ABC transporter permease n=1 Tax=Puia sp. TaxID=2045100 RepID=UPI002F41585C
MLKNYFKIAWRNLIKDRQFTFLNVLGLSVGLACTLLIGLWVVDELNMEKYNPDDARLYQVMVRHKGENVIDVGWGTPGILATALKKELPAVENATELVPPSWFHPGGVAGVADKKLKARPQYIDSNYFALFACPFLQGDRRQLFADKQGVALSEPYAMALFGTTRDIIGKTIHYDQFDLSGDFVVRGVFRPNPANATEQFDLLFNYALFLEKKNWLQTWTSTDPQTFVLTKAGADIAALDKQLAGFGQQKANKEKVDAWFLAKFRDRYLYNNYENGVQSGGRITYVRLFILIAAFILLIACINFMNLSTARAAHRAKEVGIKKVVGAGRGSLIIQYLGESLLLSFLSLGVALALVSLLLPAFNEITAKQLHLSFTAPLILAVLGMTILTGLVAGSYPAFYLSAFRPVAVLKGTLRTSLGELWARKGLVVFQFTLSVIFIAGVMIIYRQINYIESRDTGYSRDRVIQFSIPIKMDSATIVAASSFIKELNNVPGVVNAAGELHNLLGDHGSVYGLNWPGRNPDQSKLNFANLEVGYNFLETMGIKLKEGRYFSQNPNAEHEIIFNEAAIRAMGLKEPIGRTVQVFDEKRTIVGVAKDFNFESVYQSVKPALFRSYPLGDEVLVKLRKGSEASTIAAVKTAYTRFNPGMAFEYKYLDEYYNQLYSAEIRVGVLARYFAGLAVLISCLGLFGLAAFTAQKRRKEIGIRKVIGASVVQVAYLLSREFVVLVGIAIAIAFPVAWLAMRHWLEGFAYRVDIGYDVFVLTAVAAVGITIVTIGYQSFRAATANPVDSLRSE